MRSLNKKLKDISGIEKCGFYQENTRDFIYGKIAKSGCRECFWPEIDPNKIIKEKEEHTYKYSQHKKEC